jgi:hypothetical protein
MSDINIYVAASGIGLSDRDSSRLHRSPTLRTNHHTHIEATQSHDFMGAATLPDIVMRAGEVQ